MFAVRDMDIDIDADSNSNGDLDMHIGNDSNNDRDIMNSSANNKINSSIVLVAITVIKSRITSVVLIPTIVILEKPVPRVHVKVAATVIYSQAI